MASVYCLYFKDGNSQLKGEKEHKPIGLEANKKIAKLGGHAAKSARDDLEKNLGKQ